jgi:hypothetical protein
MSTFDEVFAQMSPSSAQETLSAIGTLVSNQVNGVVSTAKFALGWFWSFDDADVYRGFLATDDGSGGVQLFSDRWAGATPQAGLPEGWVEGQPYARDKADDLGVEIHKSSATGEYTCLITLNSWGKGVLTLRGHFVEDVLVAVGDSIGQDSGAGTPRPAVYLLSLKVVRNPGR